jgi:hypothetical protein
LGAGQACFLCSRAGRHLLRSPFGGGMSRCGRSLASHRLRSESYSTLRRGSRAPSIRSTGRSRSADRQTQRRRRPPFGRC